MNRFQKLGALALGAGATLPAFAASSLAAPDTSTITDALTGVGVIGLAVFAVYVGVKGYGWIRRVL